LVREDLEAQVKRSFRLTSSADIKRVRRSGKSYAHPLVVLYVLPAEPAETQLQGSRVCVNAGWSVGNAVRRNRAKRLLRAAISPLMPQLAPGSDLLLIARNPLLRSDANQAREALTALLGRAGLLAPTHGN
jgi:ribonuclease P protein component